MLDKTVLVKIREYFNRQKDVAAVYLYGSYVSGEAKKKSDIDLAVLFDENKKQPASWGGRHINIMVELSTILAKEAEVQDLSLLDIGFIHRILTEGRLIYSRNEIKRVGFEVDSLNRYFDLKPLYQEYYQVLEKRAKKGLIGQHAI